MLSRFSHVWLCDPMNCSSAGKELACNAGDPSSIPGSGRSSGEGTGYPLQYCWAALMSQTIKNPPPVWETWAWSLGWEDPLKESMATHSSILAWRIPSTEEPGGLQSMGSQRVRRNWVTYTFLDFRISGFHYIQPFRKVLYHIPYFLFLTVEMTFLNPFINFWIFYKSKL